MNTSRPQKTVQSTLIQPAMTIPAEIDHSKDHFNVDEKEYFFENGLKVVIKNGVNYF